MSPLDLAGAINLYTHLNDVNVLPGKPAVGGAAAFQSPEQTAGLSLEEQEELVML